MELIDRHLLIPGMIVERYVPQFVCGTICWVLGSDFCHTGVVVVNKEGRWGTVDPLPPKTKFTPLAELNKMLAHGAMMNFLWPEKAKIAQGERVGAAMLRRVGDDYPELTVLRLGWLKVINEFPYEIRSRHQWKDWCTLAARDDWRDHGRCDWSIKPTNGTSKRNPTPKTVQNRRESGQLSLIANYGKRTERGTNHG